MTGPRSHSRPEDVTTAPEPELHEADDLGVNTKGTAAEGRRWWGEQQQGERVTHRPQLQFCEITINFVPGLLYKKVLQHVGSESLVCGAEPEQVPFCSWSVAETLKKVVIKSCSRLWRFTLKLVEQFIFGF